MHLFYFIYFFFCLFRVTPMACGSSQTRGQIREQLLAYATATAIPDLCSIFKLHQSSQQCQILNPLSKARDQTLVCLDTSGVRYCCSTMGTPHAFILDSHQHELTEGSHTRKTVLSRQQWSNPAKKLDSQCIPCYLGWIELSDVLLTQESTFCTKESFSEVVLPTPPLLLSLSPKYTVHTKKETQRKFLIGKILQVQDQSMTSEHRCQCIYF